MRTSTCAGCKALALLMLLMVVSNKAMEDLSLLTRHSDTMVGIDGQLVPFDTSLGNLVLTQQVLRLGEDEFAYWGVD